MRELVKRDLCRLRKVASDYNFGAHAILPFMSQSEYRSPHPNGQPLGTDDVDFQSIMLYDSYAFSSNGQPTLLDNDGLPHFKGEWPSEADVFGIKTLYNDAEVAGRSAPRLPNNPASEWRRKWHQRQLASWGCVDP